MQPIVSTERRRQVLVVSCRGDLDLACRARLQAELPLLCPTDPPDVPDALVIDLSAVTFLDCSALGVLLAFAGEYEAGNVRLLFAGPSPLVRRLLSALGLHHRFTLAGSLDDAVVLAETWADLGREPRGAR